MACCLKTLMLVALLIFEAAFEVSTVGDQQVQEARQRFCAFSHEQKSTALTCMVDNYPPELREIMTECIPAENRNESLQVWVNISSFSCNPEQDEPSIRNEFLQCIHRNIPEGTNLQGGGQIRGYGRDHIRNIVINCINQTAAEAS